MNTLAKVKSSPLYQASKEAAQWQSRAQKAEAENTQLRAALKELWAGTTWGAGKAAVFESHRQTMIAAGIEDIGD